MDAKDEPSIIDIAHWRCCLCHAPNAIKRDMRVRPSALPALPARCILCANPPCTRCTFSRPVAADGTAQAALLEWNPRPRDRRGFICPFCGTASLVSARDWFVDAKARQCLGDPTVAAPRPGVSALMRRRKCEARDLLLLKCQADGCGRRVADEFVEFYVPLTPVREGSGEWTWADAVEVVGKWVGRARWLTSPGWRREQSGGVAPAVVLALGGVALAQVASGVLWWLESWVGPEAA